MFDQAALSLGLVNVPLYTDDRPENIAYITDNAAVRLLLVQDAGRWRRLADVVGDQHAPSLHTGGDVRGLAAGRSRSDARCHPVWLGRRPKDR